MDTIETKYKCLELAAGQSSDFVLGSNEQIVIFAAKK